MAKKYIDAELQIVRMNNDIVTASNPSVTLGGNYAGPSDGSGINAPGRRRGIWD